uniref:Dihydroorotate dehydrogenase B (NAD(+)), electron transfer subunit n=1 Tax=Schlesneria paludicola TaxID=360056 RepID=A0A7C4LKQ0_9PLAN
MAVQERAVVVAQQLVAQNTYRLRLRCPGVARRILPGQFFMLRAVGETDPLLGRPFALLDVAAEDRGEEPPEALDLGYVVVGKLTRRLAQLRAGDELDIWGPLGNGFPRSAGGHLAVVAGGIGQTPFVAVLREALGLRRYGAPPRDPGAAPRRVTVCYGARSAPLLAGCDWFERLGVDLRVATDDGSRGHHGFVTDLLDELLRGSDPPSRVYCCGPEPMMRTAARLTAAAGVPCWLSLETPMACGFGACFSCVTRIRQEDGTWDYRRVCVEGPVFPADQLVFEEP